MRKICKRLQGFTLIELVMVIVLIGIISVALVPVITNSVEIYRADKSRAALIQKGRLALERIAREVREAVPNTLETVTDAAGNPGIQFLSVRSGGRYVDVSDTFALLSFLLPLRRFIAGIPHTELYLAGTGQTLAAHDSLIIGNTSPEDIRAGVSIVSVNSLSNTTLLPDGTTQGQVIGFDLHTFPQGSPGRHYFLSNKVHEVGRFGNALYWHTADGTSGYDANGDWSVNDPILVDGVADVSFTYARGNPVATAVMRMSLTLTDGTENIRLYQEVHIRNTM